MARSDAADKLEALRTKLDLDDSPDAELEQAAVLEDELIAADLPHFLPREAPKPSFMDRKIQQLQVAYA